MKRIIILAVMAGLLGSPLGASAQLEALDELKHTSPEQRAKVQTAFLKDRLGLSQDQVQKVAAINLEYAEKNDPILKGEGGMFKKIRLLREDREAKAASLDAVLTSEQRATLAASREEMQQQMKKRLAEGR